MTFLLATNVGGAGRVIMPYRFSYHTGRQLAGHKMWLSRELADKKRGNAKKSAAETLKNILGLLQNCKHPKLIPHNRSRRSTSMLFCFLCKRIHGWKILPTIYMYRPKHFIDNDTRTGIAYLKEDRQTEVFLQSVPRRTEKYRQFS